MADQESMPCEIHRQFLPPPIMDSTKPSEIIKARAREMYNEEPLEGMNPWWYLPEAILEYLDTNQSK